MPSLDETFALGWKQQQAGDFSQAERIYREILRVDPENARTWFVLGTACQAQKKSAEAELQGLRWLGPRYSSHPSATTRSASTKKQMSTALVDRTTNGNKAAA